MQERMHHHSMPQPSSSKRTVDPNLRVYQVWKGNNRFFLGGRLVFGPDVRSLMFTIFLIATPVISFCVFESQRLINGFHHHLGVLIVTLPAIFTVYIVILLLLTSGRDPGIIPRNPHPPEQEEEGDSCIASEWPGSRAGVSAFRPSKDVLVNGVVIKVKYCQTCMLYRPPRCSHCSICNNCVERFDHHCPWVGQCIGKRNYRYFFLFVSSTTMLCLYVFAFCWINIHLVMGEFHCSLGKAFLKSPVSAILIVYTFIAAWFVGGLTAFHVYLISTNQTTYENFRYRYDRKMNPYNRGLPYNIWEIFFSKIPTSKSNFRSKLNEKTVLPISSSMAMGRILSPELPKKSTDIEMNGKRKAVVDEDFEDIQNQMEGGNRLERCNTPPRHANWSHKANCEITIDKEHREKITGVL